MGAPASREELLRAAAAGDEEKAGGGEEEGASALGEPDPDGDEPGLLPRPPPSQTAVCSERYPDGFGATM